MKHFPIFLDVDGRFIAVSGGDEAALAKLRLLAKSDARLTVYSSTPHADIRDLAASGRLALVPRAIEAVDMADKVLVYAANEDADEDGRVVTLARKAGVLVNHVDNLETSDFITPAIVDRDPVVVAIGTEGAAPVLARAIKAELEESLPAALGPLARVAKGFRQLAKALPFGRKRRTFWSDYYSRIGPRALDRGGEAALPGALENLLAEHMDAGPEIGSVTFVGAGPGDPDLLTLKARRALHDADVVIHDRLVTPGILDLARREALIVHAGKQGFGPSTPQAEINAMLVRHASEGRHVVRLKSGDATVFGRLDEEIDACTAAGVSCSVVPGITAASAAAAGIARSLTRRGRNSSVRLIAGHDVEGDAEHDWRALARPGEVAAIYMGKKSARFLQGRLMMHGAASDTPVTIVESATRPDQRVIASELAYLAEDIAEAGMAGPALVLYGLAPREAEAIVRPQREIAL
ncbi:MAG: uroporphyrinogen-III C-methyltransferase [Boseongicola sp. SB0664_bin_43]|uniref:Uroporphyrinogen-III C-methyltransferase n=1 Tax=Boseongicola sp. SB0664_bin_43 TaxID=2604844 RepID=A0A6B0Y551_9RHOB|nr:uroporphyrinogen-III C-methyltransferase [Boseongicola sp. SB0664_bin_43]MYK30287.1 uroporphyrinogen-III C-methyltransferase [Boseongicola sp. SB0670_bin_30]